MEQTSVANLTEKTSYSSADYIIIDSLTDTNKVKLSVIKDGMKEEIEGELIITENTQFNVSGVKFKLVKK